MGGAELEEVVIGGRLAAPSPPARRRPLERSRARSAREEHFPEVVARFLVGRWQVGVLAFLAMSGTEVLASHLSCYGTLTCPVAAAALAAGVLAFSCAVAAGRGTVAGAGVMALAPGAAAVATLVPIGLPVLPITIELPAAGEVTWGVLAMSAAPLDCAG